MGNFANEFWTLSIKVKKDLEEIAKKYFGLVEVVDGELANRSATQKVETHIEKALTYPLGKKIKSHMGLQAHCNYLYKKNRDESKNRANRDGTDDTYYPFVIEFESNKKKDKEDVIYEAIRYIKYLTDDLDVHIDDIVTIITPGKSVYVYLSPKAIGLEQGKTVHKVYTEMYKQIKNKLNLKFVDESVTRSSHKLVKTPGSYYKGGYVTHITLTELTELMVGKVTRKELTKDQRNITELNVPSVLSLKLNTLYKDCKSDAECKYKKINQKKNKDKSIELPADKGIQRACINKILSMGMIEKGNRNNLLVSIIIGLRDKGLSTEEIEEEAIKKAYEWQHDETERDVRSKVKSILRTKTKFSCEKAKGIFEEVGIDNACLNCSKTEFKGVWIDRSIMHTLRTNKGSVRHYEAYITLAEYVLSKKTFDLEEVGINITTLKEFAKKIGAMLNNDGNLYTITIKNYKPDLKLPMDFLEKTFKSLKTNAKGFLFLLIKSCNGNSATAYVSMSIKSISKYLGYTNEKSVYGFLKALEELGLLKVNKTQGVTLFFSSYKVISLEEYTNNKIDSDLAKDVIQHTHKQVVNSGLQLDFKFENESNSVDTSQNDFKYVEPIRIKDGYRNITRGSPPKNNHYNMRI